MSEEEVSTQEGGNKKRNTQLDEVNEDITVLAKFIEDNKVKDYSKGRLLQTVLSSALETDSCSYIKSIPWRKKIVLTSSVALVALLVYLFRQVAFVRKLEFVLIRLLLIQVLPWWNWSAYYREDCLVNNPFWRPPRLQEEDCNVCESLQEIERIVNMTSKRMADDFLTNDVPSVVVDGMKDWPNYDPEKYSFTDVRKFFISNGLSESIPCEFSTNLKVRSFDLQSFLGRTENPDIQRWYGHWENCDRSVSKAMRLMYKRPYFMPDMVELSGSNWVLMSSNYRGQKFKELDFRYDLAFVVQIKGWNWVRLIPRDPCNNYCAALEDIVAEGEIRDGTDNIAFAVGGNWE